MTHHTPPEHFKGKNVSQHLKEARLRGAKATSETHGIEPSGQFSAAFDSAKNTALLYLLFWSAFLALSSQPLFLFIVFGFGWTIWNTGRSALLGWARLKRLHRLIEEERWEIEHHREQEKEELREMYADKGFTGKLLEEVVEILMSDDNRLLRIMLEEELGLSLEVYEHPLRQASGAFLGAFFASLLSISAFYFWPLFGLPIISLLLILIAAYFAAKWEKRKTLNSMIWNGALALFASSSTYFLLKIMI